MDEPVARQRPHEEREKATARRKAREDLLLYRAITPIWAALAVANGTLVIRNALRGHWLWTLPSAAVLAFIAFMFVQVLHPRGRRAKGVLRDLRIADLEKELGIR